MNVQMRVPWPCEGVACPNDGWHMATFNTHDDGTITVDWRSDGHQSTTSDLAMPQNYQNLWCGYYEFITLTGKDPLDVSGVHTYYTTSCSWDLVFRNSVLGALLARARKSNKGDPWLSGTDIPEHVLSFLNVTPKGTPDMPFLTWDGARWFGQNCSTLTALNMLAMSDPHVRIVRSAHGLKLALPIPRVVQRSEKMVADERKDWARTNLRLTLEGIKKGWYGEGL